VTRTTLGRSVILLRTDAARKCLVTETAPSPAAGRGDGVGERTGFGD
jgi:hypothetical protein